MPMFVVQSRNRWLAITNDSVKLGEFRDLVVIRPLTVLSEMHFKNLLTFKKFDYNLKIVFFHWSFRIELKPCKMAKEAKPAYQ